MTTSTNPWNTVNKVAARKLKNTSTTATLRKPDGSVTANLNETAQSMHASVSHAYRQEGQ